MVAKLACDKQIKFTKLVRPIDVISMDERTRSMHLISLFRNAGLSNESLIIFDDLDVILNYADGSSETEYVSITVSDWRYMPSFANVATYCYLHTKAKEIGLRVFMSQISVRCSAGKNLISIKLPPENNIHIFAISLTL